MKFTELRPSDLEPNELIIRLFGELEISNAQGSLNEKKAKPQALTWPTLKYILVNSNRDVEQHELLALEYPGKTVTARDGAMRTRLRRVRDILRPLGLESTHGLILFSEGKYRVNPDYTLLSDEDAFNLIMRRLGRLEVGDSEGLSLCAEALEICRGVYLGYTRDAGWLRAYQEHYRREFCRLGEQILERMRALDDDGAAGLLWRRAIVVAPEAEALHKAIISFLVERRQETELLRYVSQLSHRGAAWLDGLEI